MSAQQQRSAARRMAKIITAMLRDHPRAIVPTSELRAALPRAPQFLDGVDVAQFAAARGWVATRHYPPTGNDAAYEFRQKVATPSRRDALVEWMTAALQKHRSVSVTADMLHEALDPDKQFRDDVAVTQRNATSAAFLSGMNRMFGSPTKPLAACVEEFAAAHGWRVSRAPYHHEPFDVYEFSNTRCYQPRQARSDLVGQAIRDDLETGAAVTHPVADLLHGLALPSVYLADTQEFFTTRTLPPSLERVITAFATHHGLIATYDPRLCRFTFILRQP